MKRLYQWGRHAIAIISLAVGLAALAIWTRSYRISGLIELKSFKDLITIRTTKGFMAISFPTAQIPDGLIDKFEGWKHLSWSNKSHRGMWLFPPEVAWSYSGPLQNLPPTAYTLVQNHGPGFAMPKYRTEFNQMGIEYAVSFLGYPDLKGVLFERSFLIPSWLSFCGVIGMLAFPADTIRRHFRSNARINFVLCDSCGYDLRATPNRCPECGAIPENKQPTQLQNAASNLNRPANGSHSADAC